MGCPLRFVRARTKIRLRLFSSAQKLFAAKRRNSAEFLHTPRIARLRWIATAGKQPMSRIRTVLAAVPATPKLSKGGSAALHQMQAVRLPPQTLLRCERGDPPSPSSFAYATP